MTISEFFIQLAADERLRSLFAEDPRKFIAESDLSDAQKAVLLSGDLRKVRFKIDVELEIQGETTAFIIIWWFPFQGAAEGSEGSEGKGSGEEPSSAA